MLSTPNSFMESCHFWGLCSFIELKTACLFQLCFDPASAYSVYSKLSNCNSLKCQDKPAVFPDYAPNAYQFMKIPLKLHLIPLKMRKYNTVNTI